MSTIHVLSKRGSKMERYSSTDNLVLIITLLLFVLSISAVRSFPHPINVWPQPTSFKWPNPRATALSPYFSVASPSHRHLDTAVHRYVHEVLTERHRPLVAPLLNLSSPQPLKTLKITVRDVGAPLSHGVDESYALIIPCHARVAVMKAETVWGAMRGLETFSQLVYATDHYASTLPRVGCGIEISDEPIFPHRGLMLDTARNYYKVSDFMRLMRTMSMNKMNVFHWHITDSQSFPLVLPSEPMLAEKGAYGEHMKYTVEDVRRLVEYGMQHGVRVVPEIDMPAHAGSWAKAHPEIVTCADKFWWPAESDWSDRFASEPVTGQLNPLNPKTYEVVRNVLADVISMFPDEFYHAGGDEIAPKCWEIDPSIQNHLSNNGTLGQVLEEFVNSTLPHILSLNRTVIYWEDVLLDATVNVSSSILPSENVILQTWNNGPSNTKKIVSSGFRAIVSSSDYYYLDCGHGGFVGNDSLYDVKRGPDQGQGGSWCGPFKTWQTIYDYDVTFNLTEEERKLVVGGEVAMWSEQSDPTVMDSRIWPRASAAAEALWSGNRDEMGNKRYAKATDRLSEWRHRMVARGIGAEPIQPLWCVHNPGMCNTVHVS